MPHSDDYDKYEEGEHTRTFKVRGRTILLIVAIIVIIILVIYAKFI